MFCTWSVVSFKLLTARPSHMSIEYTSHNIHNWLMLLNKNDCIYINLIGKIKVWWFYAENLLHSVKRVKIIYTYTLIIKVQRILKKDVVYNGNLLHMFETNGQKKSAKLDFGCLLALLILRCVKVLWKRCR